MKFKALVILIFYTFLSFSKNIHIIYAIKNYPDFKSIQILDSKIFSSILKNNKQNDSFTIDIDEPKKVVIKINGNEFIKTFRLEENLKKISIDKKNNSIQFTESTLNNDYQFIQNKIDSIRSCKTKVINELKNNNNLSNAQRDTLYNKEHKLENQIPITYYNWCKQHTSSFLVFDFIEYELEEKHFLKADLRKLFYNTNPILQQYPSYQKCTVSLQRTGYEVGDTIKNIILKLPNGESKNLLDIIKNKYAYIDFWSSNEQMSRLNHLPLKHSFFSTFLKKLFTIISISLDTNKQKWLDAIKVDGIDGWTNSCDLLGKESPVCLQFNITEFPIGFLVNENGIIVEDNLHSATEINNLAEKYLNL